MAKIQIKNISGVRYRANIKADNQEFDSSENKAIQSVQSKVKLDGFRKGKAPEHVLRSKFAGEISEKTFNNLLDTVSRQLAQESPAEIYKLVKIENLVPEKGKYSFDLEYDVFPIVKLPKFKGLVIKEDIPLIDAQDEDREIKEIQKIFAEKSEKPPEGVIEKGDIAVIRSEIWADGTPMGQPADNVEIWVGDGQLDAEIETKLSDGTVKAGQEVKIEREVDLPANPNSQDAPDNKEAPQKQKRQIVVTVQKIFSAKLPDLSDQFAAKYDEAFGSLKELRSDIRRNLEGRFRRKNMDSQIASVIEKIVEDSEVSFPEGFVEEKMNEYLGKQGLNPEILPPEQMAEFKPVFEKEQKKRLVNEELISNAIKDIKGEAYQNAFFDFLKNNFDRKTAKIIRELYENVLADNKNASAAGALENFLQYFHIHMLETLFRGAGIVKKNKKVKYREYMEANQ